MRKLNKLSPRAIVTLPAGRHSDGGGLYLVVDRAPEGEEHGARRWVFLFRWDGKLKEMGLGGLTTVSLGAAREKAAAARKLLGESINPIAAKKADVAIPTFGEFADKLLADLEPQWRNDKHIKQWSSTLQTYAAKLRPMKVNEVATEAVLEALKPIWTEKPETASRVRGRIERVLDAAKAKGLRTGENPARWRGHLDHLLPKRQKLSRGHHAALPSVKLGEFITALRARQAVAALALEFTILTAARSGETFGATWSEIDLDKKVWIVPAERMKAGREHRVPLAPRAVEILEECQKLKRGPYVFPGAAKDKPLSGMAMEMLLRRMKVTDATVHGFRSTFRDWAGESTNFPREVVEAALAHAVGDATERAYRRGDALEKRRKLMEAWANYCARQSGNVVPMGRRHERA